MKKWVKWFLRVTLVFLGLIIGWFAFGMYYGFHYAHQHCMQNTGLAFRMYAEDNHGQFPFSTNGFGNALLLLVESNYTQVHNICGPDDDGYLYWAALTNHTTLREDQCTRVYIQGLNERNDSQLCLLFDRYSHKGGDHFRWPWGHPLREVCMLQGSMRMIWDEDWPEFSRKQVELLVAAGFARTNALRYYPAAKN